MTKTLQDPPRRPPCGRRPLVVCVDDEPRVLSSLSRLLKEEPYDVIATDQPRKVLKLVGTRPVSLVIADQRMPDLPGTDLLRIVHQRSPWTIGMIFSAYASREEVSAAQREGAVKLLMSKPWEGATMKGEIRRLLSLRKPGWERAADPALPDPSTTPDRVFSRVECAGKPRQEALEEVSLFLRRPWSRPRTLVLILEDVFGLADSSSRFLRELVDRLAESEHPVAVVDPSGAAGTILAAEGLPLPVVVARSIQELPEPKRLLLVGPDAGVSGLRRWMESAGHSLSWAGSPLDALRKLAQGSYDLILLGPVFSQPKDIDLARRVLERRSGVPAKVLADPGSAGTGAPILPAIDDVLSGMTGS